MSFNGPKNQRCFFYIGLLFIPVIFSSCKHTNEEKKEKGEIYRLVKDWPQLPAGFLLGNPTGIAVDSAQNIFVFHRAGMKWPLLPHKPEPIIENTILEIDRASGKLIKSWGGGLFALPHGLTIDRQNNVWVTDISLHQVFKFDHNGTLLMKLGEAGVPGNDPLHFNKPTDVAVNKDGSFYVSDGYGNSRVMKFSAGGQFLFQWGSKGSAAGQFNIPHAIDLGENGDVYVADRENKRVQVFTPNGKFTREIKTNRIGKVYSVVYDQQNSGIVAVDYATDYMVVPKGSDVFSIGETGEERFRLGRSGSYNGPICRYHDVTLDNEGNLYAVDILYNKIQKFIKVK